MRQLLAVVCRRSVVVRDVTFSFRCRPYVPVVVLVVSDSDLTGSLFMLGLTLPFSSGTSGGGKYGRFNAVLKYKCPNDFRSALQCRAKSYRTIIHYVK